LPLTLRRLDRIEMETAGVEPAPPRCKRGVLPEELHPHAGADGWSRTTTAVATGLQPAELADARRPQEPGRPAGIEPTLRGSRPRVLPLHHGHRVSGRRDRLPATGGRDVTVNGSPEPAVAHRRSCQRVSAPPPPHRSALEACRSQLHVRARALHSPCSVTSSPRPSTRQSFATNIFQ
jgi:hypothetical protein